LSVHFHAADQASQFNRHLHYLHLYLQKATTMASRAFSSTARQLKQLNWSLHGTTADVSWLIQQIERSIDEVPGLRDRIVSAQVM
jgi:hypothetical protein